MQIYNFNDLLINKKYKILHQINKGSFGLIFKARDLENELDVAVKIEPYSVTKKYLIKEARILHKLQKNSHIPRIYWCGNKQPQTSFLVMELLGKNLDDLFNDCNRKFSLKTVLMMAEQMITNLEFIHSNGYVHRDINPRNICVGLGDKSNIFYSIDFGLSNTYRKLSSEDNLKGDFPFVGTLNFASINSHKGYEHTCLDDLESLFYVIVYFLSGKLPWEDISYQKGDLRKKIEDIKNEKMNISIDDLCKGLPEELKECVQYIKGLKFYMEPDYKFLKKKCNSLFMKNFEKYDFEFDWKGLEAKMEKESFNGIDNKEKNQSKHSKKTKIKNPRIFDDNSENPLNFVTKFDEMKEYEECKKNEDENMTRRKNLNDPNQIYHIKKKVKIDEPINLMKKTNSSSSKTEEIISKKESVKTDENISKNEINSEKIKQKNEEEKFLPAIREIQENKELKANVKEKYDLLFGINNDASTEIYNSESKGYCRLF